MLPSLFNNSIHLSEFSEWVSDLHPSPCWAKFTSPEIKIPMCTISGIHRLKANLVPTSSCSTSPIASTTSTAPRSLALSFSIPSTSQGSLFFVIRDPNLGYNHTSTLSSVILKLDKWNLKNFNINLYKNFINYVIFFGILSKKSVKTQNTFNLQHHYRKVPKKIIWV